MIACVCKLVVVSRKLLQALNGDGAEVAGKRGEFCEDNVAPGNEAVNQGLLPHGGMDEEGGNGRQRRKEGGVVLKAKGKKERDGKSAVGKVRNVGGRKAGRARKGRSNKDERSGEGR